MSTHPPEWECRFVRPLARSSSVLSRLAPRPSYFNLPHIESGSSLHLYEYIERLGFESDGSDTESDSVLSQDNSDSSQPPNISEHARTLPLDDQDANLSRSNKRRQESYGPVVQQTSRASSRLNRTSSRRSTLRRNLVSLQNISWASTLRYLANQ